MTFTRTFKILAVSALALTSTVAQASNTLDIIDMTTAGELSTDMVITTGFLHELDLVAFEDTSLSLIADDTETSIDDDAPKTGWAGVVEVDMSEEPTLPMGEISSFSDTFDTTESEKKMSGFYTMRYEFNSSLPFRPYAGAGLGLVATTGEAGAGGVFAGRATAGFDLTLGEGSAVFAEYAFVKSGGVNVGLAGDAAASGGAIPDSEHSLKLGFRRTF